MVGNGITIAEVHYLSESSKVVEGDDNRPDDDLINDELISANLRAVEESFDVTNNPTKNVKHVRFSSLVELCDINGKSQKKPLTKKKVKFFNMHQCLKRCCMNFKYNIIDVKEIAEFSRSEAICQHFSKWRLAAAFVGFIVFVLILVLVYHFHSF